jgi:hypothetical protein
MKSYAQTYNTIDSSYVELIEDRTTIEKFKESFKSEINEHEIFNVNGSLKTLIKYVLDGKSLNDIGMSMFLFQLEFRKYVS